MAASASLFEERREDLIARLEDLTREDGRLVALWLQGSLADGSADPLSDVDAYIAVEDAAFEQVYSERREVVARLGSVHAYADRLLPGAHAVHCVVEGPVKLDLFFEPVSRVEVAERPAARMLVDKAGIGARLRTGWEPSREAAAQKVDLLLRGIRQGATWPVRLLHRGQWSTLAMVELELVNDNLMTLMAAQVDPRYLFKNRFSVPRLLRPEQRERLDALTADVLDALVRRDPAALRDVHLRIDDALIEEGRAACAALGIPYPGDEEGDAAIRAFYEREWPATLAAAQ
ncbi:MAG: nucleotidyltransferase domain-containing protein [Dehalococcoidia bacterium]